MSIFVDTPTRLAKLLNSISQLLVTTSIFAGSQTISGGKILTEDGLGLLNEDGSDILEDSAPSSPGVEVDILTEDGGKVLTEDGEDLLDESSTNPVVVPGVKTPLSYTSIACQYVIIAAKSTNSGTLWFSGTDVAVGTGIPLVPGAVSPHVPIDDVSKVYIIGNVGDGVTFIYGTSDSSSVVIVDDDGNPITDDDGVEVTN